MSSWNHRKRERKKSRKKHLKKQWLKTLNKIDEKFYISKKLNNSSKKSTKTSPPRHVVVRLLKVKDKGKIFQAAKRKGNIKFRGTKIKISSRFFCQKVGKPEIRVTTLEY